jgi:hypothetical protein
MALFLTKAMSEAPFYVSPGQWFFANNWPVRVWLGGFALTAPFFALRTIDLGTALALGWRFWLNLLGQSLLWAAVGFLVGVVLCGSVLGPLYRRRTRLNGGPFGAGDMVVVLSGKYRGQTRRVYARWQGDIRDVR